MSTATKDFLKAKNKKEQADLIAFYTQLNADLSFFEEKLRELERQLSALSSSDEMHQSEALQLREEKETIANLIISMKTYIESMKLKTAFSIQHDKMTDTDIQVLKAQAKSIRNLRASLEITSVDSADVHQKTDQLSQLIDDVGKMSYQISKKRIWLRRAALLLTGLCAAAVSITILTALMTPGVNIVVALGMVPTMLHSLAAFIGLCKAATTSTTIFGITVPVAVPSSLGGLMSALFGLKATKKMTITSKSREIAARNTQASVINTASDELKKKIRILDNRPVKEFLLSVVEKSDAMYNSGSNSYLTETRLSKTQKARLVLRETAKLIENGRLPRTVDALLKQTISVGVTYGQLLNVQRNTVSLFRNRTSTFMRDLKCTDVKQPVISLNAIT